MGLAKEKKKEIVDKHSKNPGDTGSSEVQVALLTERIKSLTDHFKTNKKDHHSRVGLMVMIERRKKLLKYLKANDKDRYKKIIEELKLRK